MDCAICYEHNKMKCVRHKKKSNCNPTLCEKCINKLIKQKYGYNIIENVCEIKCPYCRQLLVIFRSIFDSKIDLLYLAGFLLYPYASSLILRYLFENWETDIEIDTFVYIMTCFVVLLFLIITEFKKIDIINIHEYLEFSLQMKLFCFIIAFITYFLITRESGFNKQNYIILSFITKVWCGWDMTACFYYFFHFLKS
jgi:hypothetical protein